MQSTDLNTPLFLQYIDSIRKTYQHQKPSIFKPNIGEIAAKQFTLMNFKKLLQNLINKYLQ